MEVLKSAKSLGINIKNIELGDSIMFQSRGDKDKSSKGNRNIRLINEDQVLVLLKYIDGS